MSVSSADGFPTPPFRVTIDDGANNEIVEVTAANGTEWTVVRAREGTVAQNWNAGAKVSLRWTAGMYGEIQSVLNNMINLSPTKFTHPVVTSFGSLSGSALYFGAALSPRRVIYCAPHNATQILKINVDNYSISTFGSFSGYSKYAGAVL